MGKNLIPLIADCLDVRIGEEFDVNVPYMGQAQYIRYKLTNNGLLRRKNGVDWVPASGFFERLVCGDYEIVKLPFEPKDGESYWTYDLFSTDFKPYAGCWGDYTKDYLRKNCGTVLEKTLILYLLTCPEAKNTIDEIADDFLLLPTELFRELQILEKQGYLKIKIELPGKE